MSRKINNQVEQNKKTPKKKRIRLKKSVRRTVGALMLVTALIIAAIPVGSASATTDMDDEFIPEEDGGGTLESTVPSLDEIIDDTTEYKHISYPMTMKKNIVGGFPLVTSSSEEPKIQDFGGVNYYVVNTDGYSDVQPIYLLSSKSVGGNPSYLTKYIGEYEGINYVPPQGTLNLVVGYCNSYANPKPWYNTDKSKKYVEEIVNYSVEFEGATLDLNGKIIKVYKALQTETPEEGSIVEDGSYVEESPYEYTTENNDNTYELPEEVVNLLPENVEIPGFSNEEEIVTEEVETDEAYAGGNTLNGILLTATPIEYETNPSETYYVCDIHNVKYAPINYICDDAFANTQYFQKLIMPGFIFGIGDRAFHKCTGLSTITLGAGLQAIGQQAFAGCGKLDDVYYHDSMALSTLGDGAFAETGLSKLTILDSERESSKYDYSNFSVPYSVTTMGSAVFYNTNPQTVDFKWTTSTEIGDYTFAKCYNLRTVDLEKFDITKTNIKNLDKVQGTFGDCTSLTEVSLATMFSGMLKKNTFENCPMKLLRIRNHTSYCADGEFDIPRDKYGFEIEGPEPLSMDPSESGNTLGYVYAITDSNSYPYKFQDTFGAWYYYAQPLVPDTNPQEYSGYILKIGADDGRITDSFDKFKSKVRDFTLERKVGKLPINSVGVEAFKENKTIRNLSLPSSVKSVGTSAFENCASLNSVNINTDGTKLDRKAFYGNNLLTTVDYTYVGGGACEIESLCFAECPSLSEVDFINDDYKVGDPNKYAYFPGADSIKSDAFKTTGRTQEIIFKGPMKKDYGPYEFAIAPNYISTNEVYVLYKTGNPQNLEAQYINDTVSTGDPAGVYLLKYPNQTTYVDDLSSVNVKNIKESTGVRSTMETAIVNNTSSIVVPYGIDYIDRAESKINDSNYYYISFSDSENMYHRTGNTSYKMFQYVAGLNSVTFEDGGPSVFPDRMFEAAPDLTSVTFNGDVEYLGELPFYYPDSEDVDKEIGGGTSIPMSYLDTFTHKYASPSQLASVTFNNEGTGSLANPKYTCVNGSGIIKSQYDSKVILEQILPGRGSAVGSSVLSSDELNDVTDFRPYAARDCDSIVSVDLTSTDADIAAGVFYDCDKLGTVILPNSASNIGEDCFGMISHDIEAYFPSNEVNLHEEAFEPASPDKDAIPFVTFHVHREGSGALVKYANADNHLNINDIVEYIADDITIRFIDYDLTELSKTIVPAPAYGINYAPVIPDGHRPGYSFEKWIANDSAGNPVDVEKTALYEDTTFQATYGESIYVTFYGYNDVVLKNYPVAKGTKAIPPTNIPEVPGYKFTGWTPDPDAVYVDENNKEFHAIYVSESDSFTAYFYDYDGTLISKQSNIPAGSFAKTPSGTFTRPGFTFVGFTPDVTTTEIIEDTIFTARYVPDGTPTPTGSPTATPTATPTSRPTTRTNTPTPTPASSSSTSSSSSSAAKSSSAASSSSVSIATPYFVTSQDASGLNSTTTTVYVNQGNNNGNSNDNNSNNSNGKTRVESTRDGISSTDKLSATVNGSTDNYVIRITRTQEADECAEQALINEFGDNVSAIRYLPFDISLYDSTGTTKISPIPDGVSITLTMPIPDDLAIYGGNAKVASTIGGVMEKIQPKFTMINGVPCMTYTVTHLSPYMVYVDTANLTEQGISDITPKTADGIHPKWFLCIGLAALALVLLLKRDPEEYLKKSTLA